MAGRTDIDLFDERHLGQYVTVSPEQGVTVVRLGKTDEGKHEPVRAAVARIIQLFPKEGAK